MKVLECPNCGADHARHGCDCGACGIVEGFYGYAWCLSMNRCPLCRCHWWGWGPWRPKWWVSLWWESLPVPVIEWWDERKRTRKGDTERGQRMTPFKMCVMHNAIVIGSQGHDEWALDTCRIVSLVWDDPDNPVAALVVKECETRVRPRLCRHGRPTMHAHGEWACGGPICETPSESCPSCGGKGYKVAAEVQPLLDAAQDEEE